MIRRSFLFLSRIGKIRERRLWENGVLTWGDFLEMERIPCIPVRWKHVLNGEIREAELNLKLQLPHFFAHRLPKLEHWRLYPEFNACFIDIETTGLGISASMVTLVGIYDGREYKPFIKGINLSGETLEEELKKYSILVTFYGSGFDLPFLKASFPDLSLEKPHLDLCFAGRRIGLKGGLKNIEKTLGIKRSDEIMGLDGLDAARLWKKWELYGNTEALETLVEYNRADVVNLKPLAEVVYRGLMKMTLSVISKRSS
jgi:hypothetical protein